MTDRELLEMAAKAAGIEPIWGLRLTQTGQAGVCGETIYHRDECIKLAGRNWDPLTDDGDALRLAVVAGLSVSITNYEAGAYQFRGYGRREMYADHPDRGSATRRAIVLAAAEIGRAMK